MIFYWLYELVFFFFGGGVFFLQTDQSLPAGLQKEGKNLFFLDLEDMSIVYLLHRKTRWTWQVHPVNTESRFCVYFIAQVFDRNDIFTVHMCGKGDAQNSKSKTQATANFDTKNAANH